MECSILFRSYNESLLFEIYFHFPFAFSHKWLQWEIQSRINIQFDNQNQSQFIFTCNHQAELKGSVTAVFEVKTYSIYINQNKDTRRPCIILDLFDNIVSWVNVHKNGTLWYLNTGVSSNNWWHYIWIMLPDWTDHLGERTNDGDRIANQKERDNIVRNNERCRHKQSRIKLQHRQDRRYNHDIIGTVDRRWVIQLYVGWITG